MHVCAVRTAGYFRQLCRICRLYWASLRVGRGVSVGRLFIWRRNWAGWQFPSHSFDMWHDSVASSRCHIFNWLLRSSNQRPAANKNRIAFVIFVHYRFVFIVLLFVCHFEVCPLSFHDVLEQFLSRRIRLIYISIYIFLIKIVYWSVHRTQDLFPTRNLKKFLTILPLACESCV